MRREPKTASSKRNGGNVPPFHWTVGEKRLWCDVGKGQKGTNLGPKIEELRNMVRSEGVWNTETKNPRGTESYCTDRGSG